jgi:hypothetical protein
MEIISVKTIGALVLFALVVSLTACSYATEFVVVNDSAQILNVEYRLKEFTGEFSPPGTPSILPSSQLSSHGNQKWTKLEPWQYKLDPNQRTVSVQVMPGQALFICRMHNYGGHSNAWDAKQFPLEQVKLEGASGVLLVSGELARTKFSPTSRALYVLNYK